MPSLAEKRAERAKKGTLSDANAAKLEQLARCCRSGDTKTVEDLIASGFDTNMSMGGDTYCAFRLSVEAGTTEVAKLLLENKADPNFCCVGDACPSLALTPLIHTAAKDGKPELVKLLLDYGANPLLVSDGRKPKTVASNDECYKLLRAAEVAELKKREEANASAA